MKNKAAQAYEMTNKWAEDYLNGHWSALLEYIPEHDQDVAFLLCLQARAFLMQGRLVKAQECLKLGKESKHSWAEVNFSICSAHIEYISGNFEAALFYANKAFLMVKKKGLVELKGDAGFYRALCLTQLGEKYQALALYTQLIKSKSLTAYRRDLIITNEAWLLWDLGLIAPLAKLVSSVPNPYGTRIQMMVNLLNGKDNLDKYLSKLSFYSTFPQIEKENIFLVLLEGILVYGNSQDLQNFKSSSFFSEVLHSADSKLISFVMQTLRGEASDIVLEDRDLIEGLFVKVLILSLSDQKKSQQIYFNDLLPLMKRTDYHSPFIPSENNCQAPSNSWEKSLIEKLYKNIKCRHLNMDTNKKTLNLNNKQVSFAKSPMTWKMILAFEARHRFKKEEIHQLLTSNRYRSDLHDPRIFKLIQRVNVKVKKQFGFELCQFNGANELEIKCELKRD